MTMLNDREVVPNFAVMNQLEIWTQAFRTHTFRERAYGYARLMDLARFYLK